jgi:hypothetical protein
MGFTKQSEGPGVIFWSGRDERVGQDKQEFKELKKIEIKAARGTYLCRISYQKM